MTTTSVKAGYRLQVFDNEQPIYDTGEFDNLITDHALTMGDPFASGRLCVGTDSKAPTFADTSLGNEVASVTATFGNNATIFMLGANRFARRQVTASMTGIDATIAEVGFRDTNNVSGLRSRSLVRDGNGTATVIPLKPSQTLIITYFVFVLIPDVLATGTVSTPYASTTFTIKPHENLLSPQGIFSGRFNNPFAGVNLQAVLSNGTTVNATVFSWAYDAATQTATGIVNFAAIETNRTVIGFRPGTNVNLPLIELAGPIVNPGNSDIAFELTFTWGRFA